MNKVVCLDNSNHLVSLTINKEYAVIEYDREHALIRIIDDSSEDYLYPVLLFREI